MPGSDRGEDRPRPADHQDAVPRYDSFMVRVWSTDDGQRMVRVQVRHIQTDVEESGTAVPLHWVAITLAQFLAARQDRNPGTPG